MESGFEFSDLETLFGSGPLDNDLGSYAWAFDSHLIDASCIDEFHTPDFIDTGNLDTTSSCLLLNGEDPAPILSEDYNAPVSWTTEPSPVKTPGLDPAGSKARPEGGERQSTWQRAPQPRLPREAVQALEEAFTVSCYPEPDMLSKLADQTRQSVKRIRNWFGNARARKPRLDDAVYDIGQQPEPKRLSQENLDRLQGNPDPTCLNPMEAFLISEEDVDASLKPLNDYTSLSSTSSLPNLQKASRPPVVPSRAPSIASSRPSSMKSAGSSRSNSSNVSCFGRSRRRGRRCSDWRAGPYGKQRATSTNSAPPQDSRASTDGDPLYPAATEEVAKVFLCTFCWQSFCNKYDWIRHETPVHAPQQSWLCCSDGPHSMLSCTFCGIPTPSSSHMITEHNYRPCASNPEEDRTFYRKDHFIQHLHQVHFKGSKHPDNDFRCHPITSPAEQTLSNYGFLEQVTKAHRKRQPYPPGHQNLHCGFCGTCLCDWKSRCAHVAAHFTSGSSCTAAKWWPERKETNLASLDVASSGGQVWSCRFHTCPPQFGIDFLGWQPYCTICSWMPSRNDTCSIEEHLESHKLRACDQSLYTDVLV
ncbi:hypothetical protein K491DRAFT_759046 [Lophiostoma macrostomum CBS 122681]|uniref:Homeobox domain-containing protein n=1 Tax=Lophiostoma macrostomum CBS 122681 TaxID=1314788 RepID=A0A6A6T2L0_9PLEO|nr:hypothetical protein K491DRAFT_759046 [Lophiostoma macrostomum CBS 122681]